MKNVLDSIINECRSAIINSKPIIVLRTDEIEIVRRLIESDRLVTRLSKTGSRESGKYTIPTRDMDKVVPTRLFYDDKSETSRDNFNIHFLSDKDLADGYFKRNRTDYGVTTENDKIFPELYIVNCRKTSSLESNPGIMAFIDRYMLEIFSSSAVSSSVMLIYGEDAEIPQGFEAYSMIVEEPYPEAEEIREYLISTGIYSENSDVVNTIADALLGLHLLEVERLVRAMSVTPPKNAKHCKYIIEDEKETRKAIQSYKTQILKKSNLLELIALDDDDSGMSAIGGMEKFKKWVKDQKPGIDNSDLLKREIGALPAKGVLMCGIPGGGKSEAAKSVAQTLDVPLLKLDIGQLMGMYVGESEHNMHKALKIAEAMSPCVLFIDELDKGFSGASSGKKGDDSGPFKRMFGTLLGWMQNCCKPCFIFATANDISNLPKEFFRSGRFDCLYSIYMPTRNECIDILLAKMRKAEDTVRRYGHPKIKESDQFSAGNKKVFADECFDKLNRNKYEDLIDSFANLAGRKRFVTGADIFKLVNFSLRHIWAEKNYAPIALKTWIETIKLKLQETTVHGDSKENLDSIAFCYIHLLRSNFIPATDEPMFTAEQYHIEKKLPDAGKGEADGKRRSKENKQGSIDDENTDNSSQTQSYEKIQKDFPDYVIRIDDSKERLSVYDRALRETLKSLMEDYGAAVETAELRRMLGE